MPFLAYYGCSKLLKARAVFYWGTHTRFTVSVGIDLSLTKTRRTRSADCICMDKRARISPLWEIVYYLDTCIVYLAVRETEYFTEILRNIPRMREQWCPGRFFPPPQKTAWERGICILAFSRHNFRTECFFQNPRVKIQEKPITTPHVPVFECKNERCRR